MSDTERTQRQAEAQQAFDRWFNRSGHWIYATREAALKVLQSRGIEGLEWIARDLGR